MNSIITRQNGIIGFQKWRAMLVLMALTLCICNGMIGQERAVSSGDYTQSNYWFGSQLNDNEPANTISGTYTGLVGSKTNTAKPIGFKGIGGGEVKANTTFHVVSNNVPVSGTVNVKSGYTLTIKLGGSTTLYGGGVTSHTNDPSTQQDWTSVQSSPSILYSEGQQVGCWICTSVEYWADGFLNWNHHRKYTFRRNCHEISNYTHPTIK